MPTPNGFEPISGAAQRALGVVRRELARARRRRLVLVSDRPRCAEECFEVALTEREKPKAEHTSIDAHDLRFERHAAVPSELAFERYVRSDLRSGIRADGSAPDRNVQRAHRRSRTIDDNGHGRAEPPSTVIPTFGSSEFRHRKTLMIPAQSRNRANLHRA
jgi:hypothetical protein